MKTYKLDSIQQTILYMFPFSVVLFTLSINKLGVYSDNFESGREKEIKINEKKIVLG